MIKNNFAIFFKSIKKYINNKCILKNVSLPIINGKTTILLGKSGTGKSTMLNICIGLIKPDSGIISTLGYQIQLLSIYGLSSLRKRIGLLFQEVALFSDLSVFQNIAFPLLHLFKMNSDDITKRVSELLKLVGLEEFSTYMPENLSGGQQKRVGLARALALKPDIILFDEPTSGLDAITALSVNKLIKKIQLKLGTTFFIISHDVLNIINIADYIAILDNGVIKEYGPVNQIIHSSDSLVKKFIHHT